MTKTIVTSTGSRPIRFNGFLINPGEEKELPNGLSIPEEYLSHVHIVRIEKEKMVIPEIKLLEKEKQITIKPIRRNK